MIQSHFRPAWIASSIPQVRKADCTYSEFELAKLPEINPSEGLEWLMPLHPLIEENVAAFRPEEESRQLTALNFRAIFRQARQLGITLPKAFIQLFESDIRQNCFPSWTACYFSLPHEISVDPFGSDGYIIPFLYDQQASVVWYLRLTKDNASDVLAAYPIEDDQVGIYFLNTLDLQNMELLERANKNTFSVRANFSSFLFRYWIENCLCYKIELQLELTDDEAAYAKEWKRLNSGSV